MPTFGLAAFVDPAVFPPFTAFSSLPSASPTAPGATVDLLFGNGLRGRLGLALSNAATTGGLDEG